MTDPDFTPIGRVRNQLGEGPFWCHREYALYWVDIISAEVWKWCSQTDELKQWSMPKKVSAVFTTDTHKLVVVLRDEVAMFDTIDQSLETICELDTDRPNNRSNDAKVSPDGSLWLGTMDDSEQQKTGRLWQISRSGDRSVLMDNIGIANTFAWDTKRGVFYFADSTEGCIYRFPYPAIVDTRQSRPPLLVVEPPAVPDGSAIDKEGNLWNAHWDGGKVVRVTPEGRISLVIDLPVSRPTSCCFGGAAGNTLFVTTASVGLTDTQLAQEPLAGYVLAIDVDSAGEPGASFLPIQQIHTKTV